MSELEHDMRATAESIAADAARLTGIEEEKADLDADDPRLVELSHLSKTATAPREGGDQREAETDGDAAV